MKNLFVLTICFSLNATAATFECKLQARNDLMEKFETITKTFDTAKFGMDLKSKGFTLKVRSTLIEEKDHLALQLNKDVATAVTQGPEEQSQFYLNLFVDPAFAVAECTHK